MQLNICMLNIIWWIESLKEQHLFEIESFVKLWIFTVTFDQFNAS